MRFMSFSKRNTLEYLRNPISLFFTIFFPVIMFFAFQVIKLGTGATDEIVPMFTVNRLIPSIAVFSFSFVALTLGLQIAKDRNSSFQSRLKVSPMKPIDFYLGYFLPNFLIAFTQIVICFVLGFIFGLKLNGDTILSMFSLVLISPFYISIGILLGSLFNEKSCGGISSMVIQATALLSGMFFPLTEGTFKTILSIFPFLPSIAIPQLLIAGISTDLLKYILILLAYTILIVSSAILVFNKKLNEK